MIPVRRLRLVQRAAAFCGVLGALAAIALVSAGSAEAGEACEQRVPTAVRAVLAPGPIVARDAAIDPDDPDFEDAPPASIRYPDEAALWAHAGAGGRAMIHGVQSLAAPATLGLTGPERTDRGVSDSIVRLYCGLFDRQPDAFELEYWAGRYWNGLPLVTIAEAFTTSREFVARHGTPTDLGLVTILFRDVLHREPGRGGVAPYVEAVAAGELSRGQLIVSFTESSEFVAMTATAPPEKPGLPYPLIGSGRRIIYDNTANRVYLVDDTGELVKTHLVSGRRGIPEVGRYRVYSKSRYAYAPYDGITMEYMVRFAWGEWPYGFHSIPVWPDDSPLQTSEQLGTHRSGGCIRQEFDDARFVFDWADVGTRVIVIRP